MKYHPKIPGERLYLSPMHPDDTEQYIRWMNDPAVTDGLGGTERMTTLPVQKKVLEEMLTGSDHHFAVVLREGDRLLGNVSLFEQHPVHRSAQMGIFLGDGDARGMGYGREALGLLLGYGFGVLNLHSIWLRVFAFNAQAIACYEKAGFTRTGVRRQAHYLHGAYHDEILMDILAEEYFRRGANA